MTREEWEAICGRDSDYNDIFEQQAQMSPHIAHRLVAWPVADRRALLALVRELAEKAGLVTCIYCKGSGEFPTGSGTACPDCAPLRALLEVVQ